MTWWNRSYYCLPCMSKPFLCMGSLIRDSLLVWWCIENCKDRSQKSTDYFRMRKSNQRSVVLRSHRAFHRLSERMTICRQWQWRHNNSSSLILGSLWDLPCHYSTNPPQKSLKLWWMLLLMEDYWSRLNFPCRKKNPFSMRTRQMWVKGTDLLRVGTWSTSCYEHVFQANSTVRSNCGRWFRDGWQPLTEATSCCLRKRPAERQW